MEYLGDGEGTNGNRGLAVSTAGGDDAFAGAVVAAVEDAQRESIALVHYIGREYVDRPNNLVPLTLKQVSMLTPSARHGGALSIHGMPVNTARLLGRVWNRTESSEEISFVLGDGTGSIEAKIWTIDGEYMRALREVRNGDYVVVNGSIRTRDSVMHIRAYSIRLVTNYNEITNHFLHCIYVSLDLQKQLREREMDIRRANLVVASNEQSQAPNGAEKLFGDVLQVFYRPGIVELENGASFSLIQSETGADADQLRTVIGAHVAMGNLFTTIDDDHFKCSFNG
ncbi:replication protein A 32 kDa subunit B [Triticum aestivum]|uniref:replication protein A 32 kDa subunit B n=1 Tax=Triticum aestivum TaxID=4565 RepID=UPI001D01FA20|nr:replication protein A 32 kDa subunit B-like [Triticum aestivum]